MRLAPTLLLIILSAAPLPYLAAADPAGESQALATAATTADVDLRKLKDDLPPVPSIAIEGDRVWWKDAAGKSVAFAPVAVGTDNPSLDTEIGYLPIDRRLVADDRTEVIALVPQLVQLAKAAGLTAEGFLLREGPLTGLHLRSERTLVLIDGVVTSESIPAGDRSAELEALRTSAKTLVGSLDEAHFDHAGRKTIEDALHLIDGQDLTGGVGDELQPSFIRRVVRHGWLDTILPGRPSAAAVRQSLDTAERFQPVRRYRGAGIALVEVRNAFGDGGWALSTPTRSAISRPAPAPLYASVPGNLTTVVELPAGTDPLAWNPRVRPVSAKLFGTIERQSVKLAWWSAEEGFHADAPRWRLAIPVPPQRENNPILSDYFPPHLLLANLHGDQAFLAGADPQGKPFLIAAPTGEPSDAKRFLGETAQALRSAALLDLVGQYFMNYTYDSPDSRYPLLIGNKQVKGDIHQTAEQTLATAAGGMCRGDCDDLAELMQAIAERQGRSCIVITLPAHLAAAWAEEKDGQWHVYVLQTGPALELVSATLQDALRKAYAHFGAAESFDPNGLGLALRFAGENTRSTEWRLSYRIFKDPDYARALIEVQGDWYFQTYQRGIETMRKMVAAGDTDNANYRELSGLYAITAQHDKSVEYHRKAIADTPEPESRFQLKTELVGMLFEAKKPDEAKALVRDLLDHELPEVRTALRDSVVTIGMRLASVLYGNDAQALALEVLEATALDPVAKQVELLANYVRSQKFDDNAWQGDPRVLELRRLTSELAGLGIVALKHAKPSEVAADQRLQTLARVAQLWLDALAFRDVDEPGDAPGRYAVAAGWYAAILGQERLDELVLKTDVSSLTAAGTAKGAEPDHTRRVGGLAQLPLDLPWIKASPTYWIGRMGELLAKDKTTIDRARLDALWAQYQAASQIALYLGMDSPALRQQQHSATMIRALLTGDDTTLRERLSWVQEKGDRRIRDDAAQTIGDLARFLPIERFNAVLGIWGEVIDVKFAKPKWYLIAWRASVLGARQHALLAAKQAADRYRDDPAFTEEYEFMRQLLEPPATGK